MGIQRRTRQPTNQCSNQVTRVRKTLWLNTRSFDSPLWNNSSFHGSRVAGRVNVRDMAMHKLQHLDSGCPIVFFRSGPSGRSIRINARPVLDDRHGGGQMPSDRMSDVVKAITNRLGHGEFLQKHSPPDTSSETWIFKEASLCSVRANGVQSVLHDALRDSCFRPNLHEHKQTASAVLLRSSLRLLQCNFHRHVRRSIGRPTQSYGYSSEAIRLAAQPKRSDAQEYRRHNCENRDDNCPCFPPGYAAVLAWRPACIDSIPPAHSLIPLWTAGHSATPTRRGEITHG